MAQETRVELATDLLDWKGLEVNTSLEYRLMKERKGNENTWLFSGGVGYETTPWLEVGANYRYSTQKDSDEPVFADRDKHRICFDLKLQPTVEIRQFEFNYRLRYQRSERKGKEKVYLRNRLGMEYNGIKKIKPFVSAEWYSDVERKNEVSILKVKTGISSKDILPGKVNLYLLYENELEGNAESLYSIGIGWEI
jgi:hypothetical protein